jgi:hypothetical protein
MRKMQEIIATHDEIKKLSSGNETPELALVRKLLEQSANLSNNRNEANVCELLSIII